MRQSSSFRRFIDTLHEKGVQAFVDLPMIAVLGDTSSGKSSLLSAISHIPLPSSDQLTTRCPIRIRMEKTTVSASSTGPGVFGRLRIKWVSINPANSADCDFPTVDLHSTEEIPAEILRAQQFIISKTQREISPDIIEIDLFGPQYHDITLIDLPGIVRTVAKNENPIIITEIATIVEEYLQNKRCVILAVVPANVDFHNCQILADALRVDPQTKRTIPVITKPDLIDAGAENSVVQLLNNEKTSFRLGFHMVKCRGQRAVQSNQSLEEAKRLEEVFFKTTSPWNSIDKNRLGVDSLSQSLESLQMHLIEETFPAILKEIKQKKDEALSTLTSLGVDPSNEYSRREIYSQTIRLFMKRIIEQIEGKKNVYEFDEICSSASLNQRASIQKDISGNFAACGSDGDDESKIKRIVLQDENEREHQQQEEDAEDAAAAAAGLVLSRSLKKISQEDTEEGFLQTSWCAQLNFHFQNFEKILMNSSLAKFGSFEAGKRVRVSLPNGEEVEGRILKIWDGGDIVYVEPLSPDKRFYSKIDERYQDTNSHRKITKDIYEDEQGFAYRLKRKEDVASTTSTTSTTQTAATQQANLHRIATHQGVRSTPAPQPAPVLNTIKCLVVDVFRGFSVSDVFSSSSWLEEQINCHRGNDLPCFQSAAVFNEIISAIIKNEISTIVHDLAEKSTQLFTNLLDETTEDVVPTQFYRLRLHIQEKYHNVCARLKKSITDKYNEIIEMEMTPFTQHRSLLETIQCKKIRLLKLRLFKSFTTQSRIKAGSNAMTTSSSQGSINTAGPDDDDDEEIFSTKQVLGFLTASLEETSRMFLQKSTQALADELQIILESYSEIVINRLIDVLPMTFKSLLLPISLQYLNSSLASVTDSELIDLICENTTTTMRRKRAQAIFNSMKAAESTFKRLKL